MDINPFIPKDANYGIASPVTQLEVKGYGVLPYKVLKNGLTVVLGYTGDTSLDEFYICLTADNVRESPWVGPFDNEHLAFMIGEEIAAKMTLQTPQAQA